MPGLSGAAVEARDRLVNTSLETNKQTKLVFRSGVHFLFLFVLVDVILLRMDLPKRGVTKRRKLAKTGKNWRKLAKTGENCPKPIEMPCGD